MRTTNSRGKLLLNVTCAHEIAKLDNWGQQKIAAKLTESDEPIKMADVREIAAAGDKELYAALLFEDDATVPARKFYNEEACVRTIGMLAAHPLPRESGYKRLTAAHAREFVKLARTVLQMERTTDLDIIA